MRGLSLSLIIAFGGISTSDAAIASNIIDMREATPHYEPIDLTMAKNSVRVRCDLGEDKGKQSRNLVSRKTAGLTSEHYEGVLAYNCSAVAGQPGSPISLSRDGIPIVVGMHVGNSFSFGGPTKNVAPRFYGDMRVFDAGFVGELDQLLLALEHEMTDTHNVRRKHD